MSCAGVDVSALLSKVGIQVNNTSERVGTVAIAYAAHKALSPVALPADGGTHAGRCEVARQEGRRRQGRLVGREPDAPTSWQAPRKAQRATRRSDVQQLDHSSIKCIWPHY